MEQNKKHEQEMLEQMLKYASVQSLEALYDEYADDTTDDSQPSEQLQDAVAQMLAEARTKEQAAERAQKKAVRRKHMLRRIAAALALVAAIGAVGGVLVMNVEAWRVPFLNFVFEITGEETSVVFDQTETNGEIIIPDGMKAPAYLPQSFDIVQVGDDEVNQYLIYEDDSGHMITFTVCTSDDTKWVKYDKQEKEKIVINGIEGYLIRGKEAVGNTIIWGSENEVYTLWGDISSTELEKIARSVG